MTQEPVKKEKRLPGKKLEKTLPESITTETCIKRRKTWELDNGTLIQLRGMY